jgi:hypothetical protein
LRNPAVALQASIEFEQISAAGPPGKTSFPVWFSTGTRQGRIYNRRADVMDHAGKLS